ncbi:Hsp33 family molecular chaperone HslO [Aristophania vespae]|uniref:Hsp33 family molecular chaperone HslO n=1 Tax=Aristophania vespae TaxID=2697033 RepID=A0A6P1NDE3_9PROT|nr:Hsp33 family molecular chaperone HslO [Aristophania vespae]
MVASIFLQSPKNKKAYSVNDTAPSLNTSRPAGVPDLAVPHAVLPFYLAHAPVRGRLIRFGPLAHTLLSRHDFPPEVLKLGGKALALVASMATALKFTGSFSLQIKGDGPVSLLLADCTESGALRFTARLDESATSSLPQDDSALLGKGFLAFTVDQGPDMERHQGIVAIEGTNLAEMAEHYFSTSEQHACSIHLFATQENDEWHAGALVLERIAGEGGYAQNDDFSVSDTELDPDDAWETSCTFAETLKNKEIFDQSLSGKDLVKRLFGTLDVVIGQPKTLSFGCRCHQQRLAALLERFSEDDLDHMTKDGVITMDCGFCNTNFTFPRDMIHSSNKSESP